MLDELHLVRWDQAAAFLASGSPPLYLRLLALNALFLAIHAARTAAGGRPLPPGGVLAVQVVVLGANLVVLFQPQVEDYARVFMNRF